MRAWARSRRTALVLLGILVLLGVGGVGLAAPTKADFALQVGPASQSVQQGQPADYTVTTTGTGGFTGSVAYSVSGLPSGATAAFTPASTSLSSGTASGTSALKVSTGSSSPVGTYNLTITGTSGSKKNSVAAKLTITQSLGGPFTVSAAPSSVTVAPGSTAVYTVTISRTAGFAGPVDLAPYGSWPAGVTPSFTPRTVPGSATRSTLDVTTTSGAATGTYTLYLVGSATVSGRTTYQYAQVQLIVEDSRRAFTLSGGAPANPLGPAIADQPLNIGLTNPNNKAIAVTNLTVTVTGTSKPGCGTQNYAVTQYRGAYPLSVPAGATSVTLSSLGVPANQQPQLRMLDLPTNQDACKGATVTLSFSGSAQGS